jgi:hypothetical protein
MSTKYPAVNTTHLERYLDGASRGFQPFLCTPVPSGLTLVLDDGQPHLLIKSIKRHPSPVNLVNLSATQFPAKVPFQMCGVDSWVLEIPVLMLDSTKKPSWIQLHQFFECKERHLSKTSLESNLSSHKYLRFL